MGWIVKLGGSLQTDPSLRSWLRLIADSEGIGAVVVPGGGVFADAVRDLQPTMGYDDTSAHSMAILAMAQNALGYASLEPALAIADSLDDLGNRLAGGHAVIWRPLDLVVHPPRDIDPGWDITSDSLALWLADRLDVRRVLLVKAGDPGEFTSWSRWSAEGIVDARFPAMAARSRARIEVLCSTDIDRARAMLLPRGRPAQRS